MLHRAARTTIALLSLGSLCATSVQAQPEQDRVRYQDLPPAIKLGVRAETVRRAAPVAPITVIVDSEQAFLAATARWKPAQRYPVLIDDGSPRAAELIGLFVRGFGSDQVQTRVVRWTTDESLTPQQAADRAWGITAADGSEPTREDRLTAWRAIGLEPPAIVVSDESAPERVAAAALAAFRGLPILWTKLPTKINHTMSAEAAGMLAEHTESFCAMHELPYRELGDTIDAIALCGSAPIKFTTGPDKDVGALTDRLGRRDDGSRWAWASQIHGSTIESTYRVMCSLFIQPEGAWLFDGYEGGQPWDQWDMTATAEPFEKSGIPTSVLDRPNNTATTWRAAARAANSAGVLMVNSMGNPDFFNLAGERLNPGDALQLDRPAALHIVHSWSTASPRSTKTVMGRWLDRGVFAAVGSVQEPYLTAFVPSPVFAARMVSNFPWAAAGRIDGPVWKIAVLGDPLYTLGPPPPVSEEPLPLEEVTELSDELTGHASARRIAQSVRTLVLMGDDGRAARLALAALDQDPTPELAELAIGPLFRTSERDAVIRAFRLLGNDARQKPALVDKLWQAAWPAIKADCDAALLDLLLNSLRDGQRTDDAIQLAEAWSRERGINSARAMLRAHEPERKNETKRINRAIRDLR